MQIYYFEIVTPDVDSVCAGYAKAHSIEFGDPDPSLGGARTAPLAGGGLIGVRAPMHEAEEPITRSYVLVDNIDHAVASAVEAGAELALPAMELPGHGKCAIVIQGGVQAGFWQKV